MVLPRHLLLAAVAGCLLVCPLQSSLAAGDGATFVVNSTSDAFDNLLGDGQCKTGSVLAGGAAECTLRAALEQANQNVAKDVIHFDIPTSDPGRAAATGTFAIRPRTTLKVTTPVVIDGYSQPGATPNTEPDGDDAVPKIELDGSLMADRDPEVFASSVGLYVTTSGAEIRGLVVNRFARAQIMLRGGGAHTIDGNFLGTDVTGMHARGARWYGIEARGSKQNLIGGQTPAARNVISGNVQAGVAITDEQATGNVVQGNFIGPDRTGKAALPDARCEGVLISGEVGRDRYPTANLVGGNTAAARNVISGNGWAGVEIYGGSSNRVQGNYIGLDVTGEHDLGNPRGVVLFTSAAHHNVIGGVGKGEGNVISGNDQDGVEILNASDNQVAGNFIGTDTNGDEAVPNTLNGINIEGGSRNLVGGALPFGDNLISGNGRNGIAISGKTAVGNVVHENLIGIDAISTKALPNGRHGIFVDGAVSTRIGGTQERPLVVSGNKGSGIWIEGASATDNRVTSSYVGLDLGGNRAIPNEGTGLQGGVVISGRGVHGNVIGGATADERNVISGNVGDGVVLSQTDDNKVSGNYIGTDRLGEHPVGNFAGIRLFEGANNTLGGVHPGEGNLISGNRTDGIFVNFAGEANAIQGNLIGTDEDGDCSLRSDGTCPLGNGDHGVRILTTSDTTIAGNTIAYNGRPVFVVDGQAFGGGHGIFIEGARPDADARFHATGNTISRNSIFGNVGRGIALEQPKDAPYRFGVNDYLDADDGANHLLNYPVVTSLLRNGPETGFEWTVYAEPYTQYRVEVFSNDELDPSGFGEGKTFREERFVTTDKRGIATFSTVTTDADLPSATLTGPDGSTSEFSMIDMDADAIADAWESTAGIDVNEDGIRDLDLSAKAADPRVKDIFLEWDAMEGRLPSQTALDRVVAAFNDAPAKNPPGNADGVNLHVEAGGDVIPLANWHDLDANDWPREFDRTKVGAFGEPAERAGTNWPNVRAAKALVYHYAVFANDVFKGFAAGELGDGLGGNDLYVGRCQKCPGGETDDDRAAALMHELGHNLGLGHGGADGEGRADDDNRKPNYHSIMNYLWQNHEPWMDEGGRTIKNGDGDKDDVAWSLTYSERAFPDLDESNLDETAGIGGHLEHWVRIGPTPGRDVRELGRVDWNGDGDDSFSAVRFDVNPSPEVEQPSITVLNGREDWSKLRFYFATAPTRAAGAHGAVPEEMTVEERLERRSLGDGPGALELTSHAYDARETDGVATIQVSRADGTQGEVTVDYATADGSATGGSDYTGVSGTLTFADGEFVKSFDVPLLADDDAEGRETVTLTLTNARGGAVVGRATSTLTIDDDVRPGTFAFEDTAVAARESDGSVDVRILRTDGTNGEAAVTLTTSDLTARAGEDYDAAAQTVTFGDGQSSATAHVTLKNDAAREIDEAFYVELTGSSLGARTLARIDVADDDAPAAEFVVTTTDDSGAGSLRKAILDANAHPGHDLIRFDLPRGEVQSIQPLSTLPFVTDPVTIDGYTQFGASPNTLAVGDDAVIMVELNGGALSPSAASGLTIAAGPSIVRGLAINGFSGNGIALNSPGNLVEGNFIGVDATGTAPAGNNNGVLVAANATNTVIGGADPAARNLVSDNRTDGIHLDFVPATGTVVQGNSIEANRQNGVLAAGNASGDGAPGSRFLVGGRLRAEGNVIAFNSRSGVATEGSAPLILSNSIHSNNPLERNNDRGIRLVGPSLNTVGAGPLQNRPGDADPYTNFPVLSSAHDTEVAGRVDSRPDTELLVQLFSSPTFDLSGYGEGQTFVGSVSVKTDAAGHADFTAALGKPLTDGEFITSTATDLARGSTSEFSARLRVGDTPAADVYTVNATNDLDDGACDAAHCSLREAILAANNHPGRDRIAFDIASGGVQTILVGPAPLPVVTEPTVIDGTTQPGYSGAPIVELNGQNVDQQVHLHRTGLYLVGGDSEVRGLVVNRFRNAAIRLGSDNQTQQLQSPGGNVVQGNYIGTDVTGKAVFPIGFRGNGIEIYNSPDNLIGGATPAARNVVSGNVLGIVATGTSTGIAEWQFATGNVIEGNFVGTDVTGAVALGNQSVGVSMTGGGNVVRDNVVSGNGGGGISAGATRTGGPVLVTGNLVGVDASGSAALGNAFGVNVGGGPNEDGPRAVVESNVVSGNAGVGIGVVSPHVTVRGNSVGTDATGARALPNGNGVELTGSDHVVEDNRISGNRGDGVRLRAATGNTVAANRIVGNGGNGIVATVDTARNSFLTNSIAENGALGIDLGDDGPTPNDVTDSDTGSNGLQNFPVVVSGRSGSGMTTVQAAFRGAASAELRLQFFSDGDPLGDATVTTDAAGLAGVVATFATEVPVGSVVRATATDVAGNTSELSVGERVVAQPLRQEAATGAAIGSVAVPVTPTADAGGPYTVDEGSEVTVDGSGSTAPFDPIELYEWNLDGDGAFDDATGVTAHTSFADDGVFDVGLRITTESGSTRTGSTVVMVDNVAPRVDAGPDRAVGRGETFSATGSFVDPGADDWTATVDYGDGTGAKPLTLRPDQTFALSHVYASSGTFTVTVEVADGDTAADDTVLVTVAGSANRAPVLASIGDRAIDEGGTLEVPVSAADPDGDAVTLTPSNLPPFAGFTDDGDGTGSLLLAPGFSAAGTYTLTINASDGVASDAETFTIAVRDVNRAPTAHAGGPYVADEGGRVTLDGSASTDPDGDALAYRWELGGETSSGARVEIARSDDFDGEATLTVSDGLTGTTVDTARVTFENVAPVVDADAGRFADPGADAWTATVDYGDGTGLQPLALGPDKSFDLGHAYAAPGTYTVSVVVRDDDGGVGTDTVVVTATGSGADTTPPTCAIVEQGKNASGAAFIRFRVDDVGQGLDRYSVVYVRNAQVEVDPFSPGALGPVHVLATAVDRKKSLGVTVDFFDRAGNRATCDPIVVSVARVDDQLQDETFTDLPQAESKVTIVNGDPGMRQVVMIVNGTKFKERDIAAGEVRRFDVASAMHPGDDNTITVRVRGKKGATALIVISDIW